MRPLSPLKQKILLALLAGVALGFSYSPMRQKRIFKDFLEEWKKIDQRTFSSAVSGLQHSKLIRKVGGKNGTYSYILTPKGKGRAASYQFDHLKLRKVRWDSRWRFVSFDIPENFRKSRDILRKKLCSLGFRELHKSILVAPWECRSEIEFVIDYLNLGAYVRYGTMNFIDNENDLRRAFKL